VNYKYPLATNTWSTEEHEAITEVIASGRFTMGENVRRFEEDFAQYVKSKYCVMVNSGSSAVLLMIAAMFYTKNRAKRLKRGDEIIVPAVSWSTTYYPLYQYGLKIKFVDVDLNTLNYDLNALEDAVSERTRAIMAVNLLGNPNEFDRISSIVADRDIIIFEDNCESLGAKYRGKFTGTFGIMGAFSSFFSHHICTMEGGLIVTDDEELYQILLSLRAHGWTRNLPKNNLVCGEKSDDPFEESFRFVLPGYNVRPLEIEGAIGIRQLKKLPSFVAERRENATLFNGIIKKYPFLMTQREVGESSWFGFSLIIEPKSSIKRTRLTSLLSQAGFECRPIVAGNFAKNSVVNYFSYEIFGDLKNAEYIDQCGLFIGNHHYPIPQAMQDLDRALSSA